MFLQIFSIAKYEQVVAAVPATSKISGFTILLGTFHPHNVGNILTTHTYILCMLIVMIIYIINLYIYFFLCFS